MSGDIATLGIAIDSSDAKSAATNLDSLSAAAQKAQTASDNLTQAGGESETVMRAIEAAAKRAGISTADMSARIDAASASAGKQSDALVKAAAGHDALAKGAKSGASELTKASEVAAVFESRAFKMGASLGIVGEVLSIIGPGGLAAAAGLGAGVVVIDKLVGSANRMGELSVELHGFSDATGLSTDQIQALDTAAAEFGLSTQKTGTFLDRFTVQLDEVHQGSGALYDQLQRINPALASEMSVSKSSADALNILAKAYANATDQAERLRLTRAAGAPRGAEGPVGEFLQSVADKGVQGITSGTNQTDLLTTTQIDTWRKQSTEISASWEKTKNNIASTFTGPVLSAEKGFVDTLLNVSRGIKGNQSNPYNVEGFDLGTANYAKPSSTGALGGPSDPVGLDSFIDKQKSAAGVADALNGSIGDQVTKQKLLVSALGNAADATEKLKLNELELQQVAEKSNAFGPPGSSESLVNQARVADQQKIDNESAQAVDRQRETLAEIAAGYGDVSQKTAAIAEVVDAPETDTASVIVLANRRRKEARIVRSHRSVAA